MDILGVGPMELFFFLLLALIILGPKEMVKAGRTVGRFLRKIVMSPTWRTIQQTSHDLKSLPTLLIRQAGMEEDMQEIQQSVNHLTQDVNQIRDAATILPPGKPENPSPGVQSKPAPAKDYDTSAWTTPQPPAAKQSDQDAS
jgi:Sec-independent protein translocase protein TatA